MDKYEYKLKAEEIVRLAGKKQYKAAAKIADEIRWEKVKNIQMLCTVADIYEQIGKYEESIEVLLQAQRRSPNAKNIAYKLVELYIELKDYQEATAYYHEYMQLAPHDSMALPLKYKLYKARGARLETQIAILEEFKTRDFQEEWILELARLYHQAGQGDKCVELCDEIDLWFSTGATVMRALELKRMYQPLTLMQEQKLADRKGFSYQEPMYEEPAYQEPVYEEPVYEEPTYVEPVYQQQVPQETSTVQEYVTEQNLYDTREYTAEQMYEEPVYQEPVYQEPAYGEPVYEEPVYQEPVIQEMSVAQEEAVATDTMHKENLEEEHRPLTSVESVAEAIIRMARPTATETDQVQQGFSILPKGEVVTADAEDYAFALPEAVEKTELIEEIRAAQEAACEEELKRQEAAREEELRQQAAAKSDEFPSHASDITEISDEDQWEDDDLEIMKKPSADVEDVEEREKPKGLFGKMISRLKMEDDDLDDDFTDDYDDSDEFVDDEDQMVTRGLTGQYEKIDIDDDDDENDPLNVRMTSPIPEAEEEDDYEYIIGEDDQYDDEFEEDEPQVQTRGSKRFRFFRNTMEDDEMYEDEPEEEIEEEVIPLSYATKYDTLNLQKELAKSIQQLMDATEKETVDSTLENVKKMVEQSNIPELTETMRFKAIRGNMLNHVAKRQAEKLQQAKEIEEVVMHNAQYAETEPTEDATVSMADARPKPAVELAIKLKPTNEEENIPIENILTQEDDGQLSLVMPEEEMVEKQITGQLNIEDVLREWEKQELLTETDREKRALEEARKRALEETQGIMSEIMGLLKDVIPKIGSIKDGEEKMSVLAQSLERVQQSLSATQGVSAAIAVEESKVAASAIEAACAEAVLELEKMEGTTKTVDTDAAEAIEKKIEESLPDALEVLAEAFIDEQSITESAEEAEEAEETMEEVAVTEEAAEDEMDEATEEAIEDQLIEATEEAKAEELADDVQEADAMTDEQIAEAENLAETLQSDTEAVSEETVQEEVSEELMPEIQEVSDALEAGMDFASSDEDTEELNEEQKEILAYFLAIDSLQSVLKRIVKRTEYAPEHMIITGDVGSGKTSVAMRIIKAAQVNKEEKIETIAKIKADLLNQKQITDIFAKVNGGVLIIENAGNLKPITVYAIEEALYSNEYYVQVILADKQEAIAKLLSTTKSFLNDIQMRVDLPVYTNNELAEFAKTYAEVNGYTFDGMALLALHSVIELFQSEDHITNLEDIKNIMDEAMERADKRNRKLFGKIFGKKNAEGIVLVENDFE